MTVARCYRTAALNPPGIRPEVVPVTTGDGARLRVHAYGPADGAPIVLVHGWTCRLEYWNPQLNAFAGKYRVIAWDLRGHGESEMGSAPLTTDLLADDLEDVLHAALRPGQRAVLVGHSLGGMTVQAWAGRYREEVARRAAAVVLANTAADDLVGQTTVLPVFNRGRLRVPRWLARAVLSAPLPLCKRSEQLFRSVTMGPNASGDIVDFAFAMVRSCPTAVRAKFGLLFPDLALGRAALHLTVPTTVICGTYDALTPPVHARRIADMLREAGGFRKLVELPTGHFGTLEQIERFNVELAEVLVQARGERAG
ncbi:alpha/beta hydrolase [Nocardia sp. CDC159]|uniref:Alpha/beta hydrolase n=1 Tax=Nocardia pulmonis TaxID=2951408 RepID=A0A9X2E985_9NOCA|nr:MULTISPECIES: alpha/beta hydrolase [Nocardia]MCM6775278.1 alpha/beta hydrolase [Nocardia pulmonis]MCM6787988.1 alpha/beta hydrolase [Nocardia sp. CDC159]